MTDLRLERPLDLDRLDLVVRYPWLGWGIKGVEVTQGVQYYDSAAHLTDAADRQPDNSVTIVSGKPAWVRVYVRSAWFSGDIPGVTGQITVRRRVGGFLWQSIGTLSPQAPGTVTARRNPPYATERGTLGYSLNFVIPASMLCGNLRLDVHVATPGGWVSDERVFVNATLQQTLRVAGIMVGYNGPSSSAPGAPNLTLAAPTLANLQTTSAWTLLTFPVRSAATYRTAGTITWNRPLTDAPSCAGCCTPNWVALNTAVQAVRVADGNRTDVLYYGLMAPGIPMGPVIGCNSGGVSTGSNGDGVTMAHELGHACGRPHSPCGTPGDAAYPAYEPYDPAGTPTASIGEYGLDITAGVVKSPATFKDFMSYCGPQWISLFVTGRLTNNAALDPTRVCVDRPWWRDEILVSRTLIPEKWLPDPPPDQPWMQRKVSPEPVISIIGVQHGPDEFEVRSVVRLEAESQVQNGRALDLRAELINADGRVLSSAPVYSLRSYASGDCGCDGDKGEPEFPRLIQAFVRDTETGAALRIRRGEQEVWQRRGAGRPPKVGRVAVELEGDEIHLRWSTDPGGQKESEAWAQWSNDEGRTWQALGADLHDGKATLDARVLPPGPSLVRLLISDGFHTVATDPIAVDAPRRPPEVSILSPRDGQPFVTPGAVRLWGAAMTADGTVVSDEQARWILDDREVASGLDAFVEAPEPGDHRVVLVVRTDDGESEAVAAFTVVDLPEERDEG